MSLGDHITEAHCREKPYSSYNGGGIVTSAKIDGDFLSSKGCDLEPDATLAIGYNALAMHNSR